MSRNAIVRLLAARAWTDAELAARAGISRSHLNEVKNGRVVPRVGTALRIAAALAVPLGTVFPADADAWRPPRPRRRATSCRRS